MRGSSTEYPGFHQLCRRSSNRFALCEKGAVSVEFVLWIPIMVAFLLLVADASFAFMRQANLLDISRETARIVARHGLDAVAATHYAEARANIETQSQQVSVDIDLETNTVTVIIFVKMHDLAPFGILEMLQTERVAIRTVNVLEPI